MRWTAGVAAVVLMLGACSSGDGDSAEAPEVQIDEAGWSDDQISVTATTNLPDGAILSWYAVDGGDWDDDSEDARGFVTVEDGTAAVSADVPDFSEDTALIEVAFVAGYKEQPAEIRDAYGPPFTDHDWPADWKERSLDEATVSRTTTSTTLAPEEAFEEAIRDRLDAEDETYDSMLGLAEAVCSSLATNDENNVPLNDATFDQAYDPPDPEVAHIILRTAGEHLCPEYAAIIEAGVTERGG